MRKFVCDNGKTYGVPDRCCLTCAHAPDILYDSEGPYSVECEFNGLTTAAHVCDKWEDDGNAEEETIL